MDETTSKHWTRKSYQQTTPSGNVNNPRQQECQAENRGKTKSMSSVLAARAVRANSQKRGLEPPYHLHYSQSY